MNMNKVLLELKLHNYRFRSFFCVLGLFIFMVFALILYHMHYNNSISLLKFLAGWYAVLCSFLSFIAIIFVNSNNLEIKKLKKHKRRVPMENQKHELNQLVNSNLYTRYFHDSKSCSESYGSTTLCSSQAITHLCNGTESLIIQNNDLKMKVQHDTNENIANMVLANRIKDHQLETLLDPHRSVDIRRIIFERKLSSLGRFECLNDLPYKISLDYHEVYRTNCELVIGYVPIPVGIVGPLSLNGETIYFPMATTEGCLVASTNRGCKAITQGSGAASYVFRDGITRAPCVKMGSAMEATKLKLWCENPKNFSKLKYAFENTTSFGKLLSAEPTVAGRNVYIRLVCFSGDAMGMNIVSKGSIAVISLLKDVFPTLKLVALSGNMCSDKKASAINWINGRGKSVVTEATIPSRVVSTILKTDVKTIVNVNNDKNLIGSAIAGSMGGFNAHASNIVTAIFLATGQDPAQNVESSNCVTILEETNEGNLWISCTMPCIEVGTVGGGTGLSAQSACLKIIGCKGSGVKPGDNSKKLAHVVASATMAGELSLLAALSSNHLVQAHMQHNRK